MMKHPLLLSALTLALIACNAQQTPTINVDTPELPPPSAAAKRAPMEWWAEKTGEDAYGMPHNKITVRTTPGTILYETECNGTTLVEDVPDLEDSVAYMQCWWAGGGDQFAIFIEDGEKAVIRHRTVDEEAGYGRWEDLKTL